MIIFFPIRNCSGAPVLHSAPTAQASSEPPMTTIARQQQIYNSHNGGTAGNSTLSITLLSSTDETVSIADKVAIACNLLNSHIFTNLSAGLPLTLYIGERIFAKYNHTCAHPLSKPRFHLGNVPPELEDAKLTKVLEVKQPQNFLSEHSFSSLTTLPFHQCFGRVTKWNRPVDPVNLIPRVRKLTQVIVLYSPFMNSAVKVSRVYCRGLDL